MAMGPGPALVGRRAAPHIRWSLIGATSSRSSYGTMMDCISAAPTATCRFACAHSASLRMSRSDLIRGLVQPNAACVTGTSSICRRTRKPIHTRMQRTVLALRSNDARVSRVVEFEPLGDLRDLRDVG
jgi:hypothetical protein